MDPVADFNHKYININDIRLHYVESGEKNATTIVMCHGWPDLWYGWRYQIKALEKQYHIIVPDLRGYGQTSAPWELSKYGHKIVTSDMNALLDAMNVQKAIFLGHDWGGDLVWRMCLYYPHRVIAVCSFCTPYFPRTPKYYTLKQTTQQNPRFKYQLYLAEGNEASDTFEGNTKVFFNGVMRGIKEKEAYGTIYGKLDKKLPSSKLLSPNELEYYVNEFQRTGFRGCLNWYRCQKLNWENEEFIGKDIPHSALFISAANDVVLHPSMSKGMEAFIPNLQRMIVRNCGHWILVEAKEEVNAILSDWLTNIRPDGPVLSHL